MSLKPTAKTFTLFTLSITFAGLLSSCVGPGIAAQADVVRADIAKAKKSGAYECAPTHLARAEAHVDFTEAELAEGDFIRAKEHIDTAIEAKDAALKDSVGCAPKKILIKKNLDSDGDGITDQADACPDNPEDKDNYEDSDGCPDPDNDQDTVLDPMDECPNQKGPVDNNGCPFGDKDGDGINDKDDKCPLQAEDFDEDRDQDGCPDVDTDKDGLEDDVDQCPTQPKISMASSMKMAVRISIMIKMASLIRSTNAPSKRAYRKPAAVQIWTATLLLIKMTNAPKNTVCDNLTNQKKMAVLRNTNSLSSKKTALKLNNRSTSKQPKQRSSAAPILCLQRWQTPLNPPSLRASESKDIRTVMGRKFTT